MINVKLMINSKLMSALILLYELLEQTERLKHETDCLEDTQTFFKHMDTIEYLANAINILEKIK